MELPEDQPVVVVACRVFQTLIEQHLPPELARQITFLDYGLHRVPRKLNEAVQETIDQIEQPSLIVLGYGLCGNGLDNIKARQHTLLIPRSDDCIAILLGSYEDYQHQFQASPGTYYLTKGWLEAGTDPLKEYEQAVQKYGQETALWIMDQQYQHYKRLVFVAHSEEDLLAYQPRAQEVARFCERWGMQYEEVLGSDGWVRRLIDVAAGVDGSGGDFLIIAPGGEIRQSQFLR